MILLGGAARRAYDFPAPIEAAFAFHRDVARILHYLPHITIVTSGPGGQFRLLYSNIESGVYQVRLTCDVVAKVDDEQHQIRILPDGNAPPPRVHAGLQAMTGSGRYRSEIRFLETGLEGTRIEFSMELSAGLPVPFALRWLPSDILQGKVQARFQHVTEEIIRGFIRSSTTAFLEGMPPPPG